MIHTIRRLHASDVRSFRTLRLDALRLHPEAFGSSFEEESREPPEELVRRFLRFPAVMFGGFAGDAMVGMTGLLMRTRRKTRHKGDVFGVYVDAAYRHGGLGRSLVEAAIGHARDAGLLVLHLTVTVGNDTAQRMYQAQGFARFATERRALCVDDVFYDIEHMALDLD
jgi:ribosomal protein S18 acetylase RimI-like enzyme